MNQPTLVPIWINPGTGLKIKPLSGASIVPRITGMRTHLTEPVSFVFIFSILFYPLILQGRQGTTYDFATTPCYLVLFTAALVKLAKFISGHSLILSSHPFFCLPLPLFPFTVPCRIVFAKPEDFVGIGEKLMTKICRLTLVKLPPMHVYSKLLGRYSLKVNSSLC